MWIFAAIGVVALALGVFVAWIAWKTKKEGNMIYKPELRMLHIPLLMVIVIGLPLFGGCSSEAPVPQYTLMINTDGSGTPTGADVYDEGATVSIGANADTEWEFVEWTGDISTISDRLSSGTTIVMDGDYTITAKFRLQVVVPTNISNMVFNLPWPATLDYGEQVIFEFDYYIDEGIPVYIIPRPISDGALAPGYLASGSNQYDLYKGKGESGFTVNPQSGQVVVDQIRFQITSLFGGAILYEFFIPVNYTFQ